MSELSCRTALLWMQDPVNLAVLDARQLDRHLTQCAACGAYRTWQTDADRHIQQSLAHAVDGVSVHAAVRAQILQGRRLPGRRWSLSAVSTALGRLLPRSLMLGVPVAAVVALLVVLVPQAVPANRTGVPHAGAAVWTFRSPYVGYPLVLDPSQPDHLLAGAWGGVYESWDGAQTWHSLAPLPAGGGVIRAVTFDRVQRGRYLVATKHSVFVSSDAGRHWTVTAASVPGAMNMFLMQSNVRPRIFYLGPSVLWTSPDRGTNWIQAGSQNIFAPDGIQALTEAPDGGLYTGVWGGGVSLSRDGGRTWTARTAGLSPHVVDVTAASTTRLWAATDRGVYGSTDAGRHWRFARGPGRFEATTVVAAGKTVLAGGRDRLYRSLDGGRRWSLAMDGMPVDPYVSALQLDPRNPRRVYASLNSDGIFRSDDGGSHWRGVGSGLPLKGSAGSTHFLLFGRRGVLWITNTSGADPGNLTVETDVELAALAPDSTSIAYLASMPSAWAVRLLEPGGSQPRTLVTGRGRRPTRLLWSADSALLAVARPGLVSIMPPTGVPHRWFVPIGERLLGWNAGGRALLFWRPVDGIVLSRSWDTGRVKGGKPGTYRARPVPAHDGVTVAMIEGARLWVGHWGRLRQVGHVPVGCRMSAWSTSDTTLLLACGQGVALRSRDGRDMRHLDLPANTTWSPGSDSTLVFFRHHTLWRWSPATGIRRLVVDAVRISR